MFLFLSKLLPLFVYPLGLCCVLLGVAIATQRRHPRWSRRTVVLALIILLVSANPMVAKGLIRHLERQYPPLTTLPEAEAIVILGGGVRSPDPPRPWAEVNEGGDRMLYGAKLYRQSKIPWVILSGGRIPWQGGKNPESEDMATLMYSMGVPAIDMIQDRSSLNTYENAVNVKRILQRRGINGPVLLVTSAFHMPRSMAIFKKQGIVAIAAPTDFWVTTNEPPLQGPDLFFRLLPDATALEMTTKALKEYLGAIIYRLRGWT